MAVVKMTYEEARALIEDGCATKLTTISAPTLRAYFNCTQRTIHRWITTGQLPPPVKIGRNYYWKLSDIRKVKEQCLRQQVRYDRRA